MDPTLHIFLTASFFGSTEKADWCVWLYADEAGYSTRALIDRDADYYFQVLFKLNWNYQSYIGKTFCF